MSYVNVYVAGVAGYDGPGDEQYEDAGGGSSLSLFCQCPDANHGAGTSGINLPTKLGDV